MSAYVSGNDVVQEWTILDTSSNPLTGMVKTTDITITLHNQSGSTFIASSETVTMTEIAASAGHYYFVFTPTGTGLYVLQFKEINASTLLRTGRFDFAVVSAGSTFAPAFSNAFCAETDMERWIQQAITSSSSPSSTEAAGFAESRAAVLMSFCAAKGFTVTPSTVTANSRIEDILRDANCIGAALDYTIAQSFRSGPSRTERIPELLGRWNEYLGDPAKPEVPGVLEMEIRGNLASLSTDHIVSGDTQAAPTEVVTAEPIQIRMGDLF